MADDWVVPKEAPAKTPPADSGPDDWVTPPPDGKAKPPKGTDPLPGHLRAGADLLQQNPVLDVAHAAADIMAIDPARSLASDIIGFQKGGADPEKFYAQREKALKATEDVLPEKAPLTKGLETVAGYPGMILGKALPAASEIMFGSERTRNWGPYATTLADAFPLLGIGGASLTRSLRPSADITSRIAERDAAIKENLVRNRISKRFQAGVYEGGPGAIDAAEALQAGRREGQDVTLLDVNNPVMRALGGTTYREGGAGGGIIRDFLRRRHEEQATRVESKIGEIMGDPSTFSRTADQLSQTRSQNARPVWDEAMQGPGLQALESQFTRANMDAGRTVVEAQQAVRDAENRLTQARGRQSQAGNVYSSSGSNLAAREAQAGLIDAQSRLDQAVKNKLSLEQLMRTAQEDGTYRPGAVWSPYLEMLRTTDRDIQNGIARGWKIETREAHSEGKQPNPMDYAIKGFDENGDPIVGAVPNMKLWAVAKEGMDAEINDSIKAKNGHADKPTRALIKLRNGLVDELDRLNPRYKAARDQWGGDTASMNALQDGRHMLKTGENARFDTDADLADYVAKLSDSDREFMKLGLAQDILEKVKNAPYAADAAKRMVNTPTQATRIRLLLGPEADRFLGVVQREADMEQTYAKVTKGSETREREVADTLEQRARRLEHFGQAGMSFWRALTHANPLEALRGVSQVYRGVRAKKPGPDMEMNEAVARVLTDPNVQISTTPGGEILPPIRVPRAFMLTPGRVLAGSQVLSPRDTDTKQ